MSIGFVVGNGISRKPLNVGKLPMFGMVYGCNALYRDMTPDVLVATDAPISERIQQEGYAIHNRFYTRNPIAGFGAKPLSTQYRDYCSGANALALACQDKHDTIYLVGFDFGSITDTFNNIYSNSEFYKDSTASVTNGSRWVVQFANIIKAYPNIEFIRVVSDESVNSPDILMLPNFKHLPISNFANGLNTR